MQKFTEMQKFTDWLKQCSSHYGICDPPMEAQQALSFLRDYLLGEDWYVAISESRQQVNTAIVFQILRKYSRPFRKEYKRYCKARKGDGS